MTSVENIATIKCMKRRAQLELELKSPARWGGARAGAGRKAAARARVWHRGREEFPERHPGLVTIRVRGDVPSLRGVPFVRAMESSLRACRQRAAFRVVHYSIQSDHVHLLIEAVDAAALACGMKSVGARLARAVNRVFGRRGAVLDGRYHHRALRTPREVRAGHGVWIRPRSGVVESLVRRLGGGTEPPGRRAACRAASNLALAHRMAEIRTTPPRRGAGRLEANRATSRLSSTRSMVEVARERPGLRSGAPTLPARPSGRACRRESVPGCSSRSLWVRPLLAPGMEGPLRA